MARNRTALQRWYPSNQPQTLQIAVALLYWNAALSLLFGLIAGGLGRYGLLLMVLEVAGGLGVANERKWGYVVAVLSAAVLLALLVKGYTGGIFTIIFEVALLVALFHPMSRHYYKIWFR